MHKHIPLRSALMLALVVALLAFLPGSYSVPAPATAQAPIRWKVQSAWPPTSIVQDAAKFLVETIEKNSGGRLRIGLSPAGAVVPPFEIQDAVNRGVLDGGHTTPGYIIGKLRAFIPLTHGPLFGMDFMPDLRQPASYQEVLINKAKWDALPKDLQAIVKWAGMAEIIRMTAYSVDLDSKAVEELQKKHGVKILKTPDDVLKAQLPAIDKVYEAEAQKNPFFAKVLKSQKEFAARAVPHAQKIRPPIEVVIAHYWKK